MRERRTYRLVAKRPLVPSVDLSPDGHDFATVSTSPPFSYSGKIWHHPTTHATKIFAQDSWAAIGGVTDHGALTGLDDPDHDAVYPGIAQTELITGTWVFNALKKGMEIRNTDEYTSGSSTGGIQEAHDNLPARGGIILIGPRSISYGTAIEITKPCFIIGAGRGLISTNPNAGAGSTTELIWTGSDGAAYMMRLKAAASYYYFGGGIQGVTFDGADKANVGVQMSSTAHTRVLDFHGRGCKVAQIKVDGDSGVLSFHNHFDNIHITTGANPATAAAHGIMFDGSVGDPTTENFIGKIAGLVQNGYLVWMKECDHCVVDQVHAAPTGTGGAVYFDGTANSEGYCNTFHFVSGDVSAKSGSFGNKILHFSNEGIDFTKLESGADIFYMLSDYGIGKQWFAQHYQLRDSESFTPGDFMVAGGAPSTHTIWAAQWAVWFLDDEATEGIGTNFKIPYRWRYGRIAFHITWGITTNAAGNVQWRVVAERGAIGSDVATPDYDVKVVEAVPANNVTIEESVPAGYMEVNAGDVVLIRVERFIDALDTYDHDAVFIGLQVRFFGRLPKDGSETAGSYFYPST